jgi:hypothetical protein
MTISQAFTAFKQSISEKYSNKKPQDQLPKYDIRKKNSNIEFEIRFGHKLTISKMDFERVYNKLLSFGFVKETEQYHLKVITEHKTPDKQNTINIRTEINDLSNIREYCRTGIIPESATHLVKQNLKQEPFDNSEFDFRISIQNEYTFNKSDPEIVQLYENWKSTEKIFRYMNRIKMVHPDKKGICIDLSIVKFTKNKDNSILKEIDFSESKLFKNDNKYEIELEINDLTYLFKEKSTIGLKLDKLLHDMKDSIKYVLSGFQMSNYPIPNSEKKMVLSEYGKLIGKRQGEKIDAQSFIGYSSYTLQQINLIEDPDNKNPCVLNNFCVTDKADGDRKLLYISSNGRIYYITMNMVVQYTGSMCTDTRTYGTIIDGENIILDKNKQYVNMYAAFDIYFIGNKDVRTKPFITFNIDKVETSGYRYSTLQYIIDIINTNITYESELEKPTYTAKRFYLVKEDETKINIHESCKQLFKSIDFHTYPYETDGIIFTSTNLGVGMETPEDKPKNFKYTWKNSFKWKPPEFNTIDFLVKIQKNGNQDIIEYVDNGKSVDPYKILSLSVGYDVNKDGELHSQQLMFDGVTSTGSGSGDYKAVLFSPTNPIDQYASVCYVPLKNDTSGEMKIFTENNEIIEHNMVVECKYVMNKDRRLAWIPLRIRYDKTEDFNKGKSFGNAFRVANSNWYTIHYPITKNMLLGIDTVNMLEENEDVYYNVSEGINKTEQLKKFHNIGVKSMLLDTVSKKGMTLIDYAVGRGGDLNKWNKNKLSFVLGIDISKDNIHNPKGGVCSRYIGLKKKWGKILNGLFIHGDTSKLLENGDFAVDDDKKEEDNSLFVYEQVMGKGKAQSTHGKYIAEMFGVASDLFDIGSIQFAIHYMFEDKYTLHNFIKNCADTIKVGGYFIGTCYDGQKVFNMLKDVDIGETKELYLDKKKIWHVKKQYNSQQPFNEEDVLGYSVSVYQESINKEFSEYLVHFEYFVEIMANYGFMPMSPLKGFEPIGSFETIYKKGGYTMTPEEQQISFLNNYFIFKKVRTVSSTFIHNKYTSDEDFTFKIGNPEKLNKKIILNK